MSLTNLQVIDSALGELGIVGEGETATAEQGADALRMMNQMLADWSVSDMDLQVPPQDTLSAVCPIPRWAETAVISNLAANCASLFRTPISPILVARVEGSYQTLGTTLINAKLKGADMSHLPQGDYNRWDVETDR